MKKILPMITLVTLVLSGCGKSSNELTCQGVSKTSMATVTNPEQEEVAKLLKFEILTGSPRYSDIYGSQDTNSEIKFKINFINDSQATLPVNISDNELIEKNFNDFRVLKLIDKGSVNLLDYSVNNKDDLNARSHIFDFIKFNRGTGNIEIMFSVSKYDGPKYAYVKRTFIKGNCSK